MNAAFSKRQRRFLGNPVSFLPALDYPSLSMVTWKHVRTIVAFVAVLCFVDALAAQSNGEWAPEPSQTTPSATYYLGPPSNDGPTVVRAVFQLQDIVEINDEAETFQFTGVLTLTWKDRRQAFDPEKEQVQEKIYQGNYQFNEVSPSWYPQVVLANESGMYESYGVLLRVLPDGTSTLIQTVSAIAEANFRMRRYPFDEQRLEAVFQMIGFDSSEVVFEVAPKPIDSFWKNMQISQWELAGIRSSTGEQVAPYAGKSGTSSTFTVGMEVQRKPFFVIRLVVIPLVLIVMLSWSVFWMEHSSLGDRISVSFIGILTAVAYQNLVSEIVPHMSYFTIINAFLNFSFLVMCATVAVNLVVGAYDKHGKPNVGDLIDYYCRWIFPLVYFVLLLLSTVVMFVFF
jgi:hypothetical protein